MHRSGTSAMTGMLNILGFYLGKELFPPRDDNPRGFFENARILELNDELLSALGSCWEDEFDLPDKWRSTPGIQGIKRRIDDFGVREFGGHSRIAVKDPRLCLTLPLWEDMLQDAGFGIDYLILVRHPNAVAASLQVRNRFSFHRSYFLWMKYIRSAERLTRLKSRLFVTFDDLVKNPLRTSEIILDRFGFPASGIREAANNEIKGFIDVDLYHHKHIEGIDMDVTMNIIVHIYSLLEIAAHQNTDDEKLHESIDSLLHQYDQNTSFLKHPYVISERRSLNQRIHELECHVRNQNTCIKNAYAQLSRLPSERFKQLLKDIFIRLFVNRIEHLK